ncbi:hypothetical protein AB0K43_06835 [Kitasatospora sp. NPDC049258]|uniref:hypothetical protein n=1 Tax=Kitasatospora sp. NPDC049258 TaxID=3155394 RepID=UPI0034455C9F
MPAVAVLASPTVPIPSARPEPVRQSRAGRDCPVCADHHRFAPAACAVEFAARTWITCHDCAGTGWDSTGFNIWCPTCCGNKILEG